MKKGATEEALDTGCGCAVGILLLGAVAAILILCVGAAWWMIKAAWQWSFGAG
jgi:hypothetical protein